MVLGMFLVIVYVFVVVIVFVLYYVFIKMKCIGFFLFMFYWFCEQEDVVLEIVEMIVEFVKSLFFSMWQDIDLGMFFDNGEFFYEMVKNSDNFLWSSYFYGCYYRYCYSYEQECGYMEGVG